MFSIKAKAAFEAAHRLVGYQGKCSRLHGHNWVVEATVEGNTLDEIGILLDFKNVKSCLKKVLDTLDHQFLNEIEPFDKMNPSAENISKVIFDRMKSDEIFKGGAILKSICVWESPDSCVTYTED